MRILTLVLSIVACGAGLLIGGLLLILGFTCLRYARDRGCGLALLSLGLVEIALPTYALWQALASGGGLLAALLSIALSLAFARMLPGLAHGVANP